MGVIYKKLQCGCVVQACTFGESAGGCSISGSMCCGSCSEEEREEKSDWVWDNECEVYSAAELVENHGWSANYIKPGNRWEDN